MRGLENPDGIERRRLSGSGENEGLEAPPNRAGACEHLEKVDSRGKRDCGLWFVPNHAELIPQSRACGGFLEESTLPSAGVTDDYGCSYPWTLADVSERPQFLDSADERSHRRHIVLRRRETCNRADH
jgi:hypothetical protein